jgi:enamine deaminase RidA (YjgF/YER057c/UK114 family)
VGKRAVEHPELGSPPDFSRAVVGRGETVWFAGQAPTGADGRVAAVDAGGQAEACFRKLQLLVEHAGGTLDDVVMLTIYLRDIGDVGAVTEVQRRFFTPPFPAVSAVEVSRLVNDEWLLEIDAVASLG